MKKKSKIILGGCIVVAALIGLSVWNTWFSATKIAFVNFQTIQQGSISKANDNSFIKLSEVSLDNLDRLTSYDMVFINGMGLRIVEEQRQQIQQAADKGIPVYTSMATNPANNICNLDSIQQNLIRGYLSNGGKTNYRNMLNYIRKAIDGKASAVPEVEDPIERPSDMLYHAGISNPDDEQEFLTVADYEKFMQENNLYKEGARKIMITGQMADATDLIKALENAGIKSDDKGTKALFFMSAAQAKALAELAVEGSADKKQYRDALKAAPSMDMALFGRMVADDPSLNYDAAAQVAHSISTHAVQNEYDYFTAVDDCQAEDNAGAGHLGTVEYNSSTLYRYATVNVMELAGQLGAAQAAETVRAFGEAFLFSMPTGKQNTFANRTLPDAVYVTLREDQPVNLCGAFERAVPRSAQGYAAPSKAALAQYAQQMYSSFAEAPAQSFTVGSGLEELAPAQTAKAMLDALEKAVRDALAGNEVG